MGASAQHADMTSRAFIEIVATVEPWFVRMASATVVVLLTDWLLRDVRWAAGLDAPMPARTERRLLGLVLAGALGQRLVGWDSALTPVFWFSEISTLYVDSMLRAGTLWAAWLERLRLTQAVAPHDSAVVLPVLAGFQALVGPRFGLPVLGGALGGGLGVLLAWALGRRVRSQAFGLAFAAFVAMSPLNLTWSRLSPLCIGCVPHVLLALLVGWEAGRRGSVGFALLAAVVAWTSVYEYQATRVAIPLAAVGIVAGSQRGWRLRRGVLLVLVAAAAFGAIGYALHGDRTLHTLWPAYGGYTGNKGERTLDELVRRNAAVVAVEAQNTVERYFATRRTGWASTVAQPGMQNGGLCLVPVALLGLAGLLSVVRNLRRQWLWLALGLAGFALPALSVMTARRALVFDLAWCAFAAHGLLALVEGAGSGWARPTRQRVAAMALVVLAGWSTLTVFVLNAALSPAAVEHIPFGEAGFGDGIACGRCLEAAKQWTHDMADGAFVVLFDNDLFRENRTSPGGLVAYGKIASLLSGAPDRFLEGYGLMADWDIEPPTPGLIFDKTRMTFADYLESRIARTAATRIIWQFECPTSWERWLAGRLALAGGVVESYATVLGFVSPRHRRSARRHSPSCTSSPKASAKPTSCVA
jgi:hypothetical protein